MKIGVFSDADIPSLLAHSFSVMKTAQGMAALGHETRVVTANSLVAVRNRRRFQDLGAHYGISRRLDITWLPPSLWAYLRGSTQNDAAFARRAARLAAREGLGLVYARSYLTPALTARAGIPTVVETHTVQYDNPFLAGIYQVAGLEAFRGLVTIHADIAREHARRGVPAEKILVLEDGVDLERFQVPDDPRPWRQNLGLDPDKHYAVYAGHLYADKGIEVILRAALALAGRPDLEFLLVGGFPQDRQRWQDWCRDQGAANVRFTGFVPNAQVPGYLKAASCLLLPYQPDQRHTVMDLGTTSPLKLFEYMAARRPIVATAVPTVAKVLQAEYSGLLAPPGDLEAFAQAILRAIDEPGLAQALARNAWQAVQPFSWTQRCRRILDLALGGLA
ncbi:MAG: glycosyltransferase family 4 protein [Pseudomonadota bacterium]